MEDLGGKDDKARMCYLFLPPSGELDWAPVGKRTQLKYLAQVKPQIFEFSGIIIPHRIGNQAFLLLCSKFRSVLAPQAKARCCLQDIQSQCYIFCKNINKQQQRLFKFNCGQSVWNQFFSLYRQEKQRTNVIGGFS